MIFIDSNIPRYLVGASHPLKVNARRLLEEAIGDAERLVTDAEVLQEILHRYIAIDRRAAIQPAFDMILGVVDEVFPPVVSTVSWSLYFPDRSWETSTRTPRPAIPLTV